MYNLFKDSRNVFINFSLFVWTFIIVIEPWVKIGGGVFPLSFLFSLPLLLVAMFEIFVMRVPLRGYMFFLALSFLFSSLYSFVHYIGNGLEEEDIFTRAWLNFFSFVVVFGLFRCYQRTTRNMLYFILLVFSFHSLIIIFEFFFIDFRIFIEQFLPPSPSNINEYVGESLFRMRGLSLSSGAGLSVLHSLAFFIGFVLLEDRKKHRVFILFLMLVIAAAMMFIARTGFIGLFFSLIMWLSIHARQLSNKIYLLSKFSLVLAGVGVLIYLNLDRFINPVVVENFQEYVVPWLAELWTGKQVSGEPSTIKIVALEMLFMPHYPTTLLLGDGYWRLWHGLFGSYIPSDSGYVRDIFALGVLGMLIHYFYLFIFLLQGVMGSRKNIYGTSVFFMFIYMLLINFKEPFILMSQNVKVLMFILLFYIDYTETD